MASYRPLLSAFWCNILSLSNPFSLTCCWIGEFRRAAVAPPHVCVCMTNKHWAECDVSWVSFKFRSSICSTCRYIHNILFYVFIKVVKISAGSCSYECFFSWIGWWTVAFVLPTQWHSESVIYGVIHRISKLDNLKTYTSIGIIKFI